MDRLAQEAAFSDDMAVDAVQECEEIAAKTLKFREAVEVKKFLRRTIRKKFPGIEGIK